MAREVSLRHGVDPVPIIHIVEGQALRRRGQTPIPHATRPLKNPWPERTKPPPTCDEGFGLHMVGRIGIEPMTLGLRVADKMRLRLRVCSLMCRGCYVKIEKSMGAEGVVVVGTS